MKSLDIIKVIAIAEYKELTAPFGRLRGYLPLMISGFIMAVFFVLFLLIDAMFSLLDVTFPVTLTKDTLTVVAFVITLETFLSFFLPISVPMSRFTMEGRDFDLIFSLPIRHWHLIMGIFIAEAVLSLPLFIFTGTGSIFLLTYLLFRDLTFTLEITVIAFIFLSILTTTALWIGLLITRFITQSNNKVNTKSALNITIAAVGLILILLVDLITKKGINGLQEEWMIVLPPTQAALLLIDPLISGKIDVLKNATLFSMFFIEIVALIILTILIAKKIHLQTPDPRSNYFTDNINWNLHVYVPDKLKIDWILFKRFIRDPENTSRLFLGLVLSMTILFLFQRLIIPNVSSGSGEVNRFLPLLIDVVTIFGFLGMISIIAFLESSFFAMEAKETIFLFLTIPRSLRTVMTKKLIQIEFLTVIIASFTSIIGWIFNLLPGDDFLLTWISLIILGIPIPFILLGMYQLNPPSDEQDITHMFNAFLFFMFLLFSQFIIFFLIFWFNLPRLMVIIILSILFLIFGFILFMMGLQNLEQYDLGKGMGPFTRPYRVVVKSIGLFVIIHFSAILASILTLKLSQNLIGFILGFHAAYFIGSVLIINSTKKPVLEEHLTSLMTESKFSDDAAITKRHWSAIVGIAVLGLILTQLVTPSPILSISITSFLFKTQFRNLNLDPSASWLRALTPPFLIQLFWLLAQATLIFVFILFVEELFFRKALIEFLEKEKLHHNLLLFISAFFFMVAHASLTFASAVTTFLLGIFLGQIYWKQRSLKKTFTLHLGYNIIVLVLALLVFLINF